MDAPNPKVVKKTRPAPPRPQAGEDDLGVSTLPMSRVAKIIKADSEIHACSKEATFLIGIATEFFLKKFVDAAYLKARTDQRKTVQLKDMSNAVRTNHELMFLEDMIPAPIPLEQALALRAEKEAALAAPPLAATLDDGEDRPSVHAPKPRGATEKAYTALERPGQQPFFLPNAAIVNARRAKVGSGQGGASGAAMTDASDSETGSGPAAPKPAPRVRKASSPRPPKDFSTFKKQERLPSTPNSLPTRARKSGLPAVPIEVANEAASKAAQPTGRPAEPMQDVIEMA